MSQFKNIPAGPEGRRTAFSMLELVIVIVILGIVAAIAVPRLSRGSEGAAEAALEQDLSILRNALELYRAEHAGSLPDEANIIPSLVIHSNHDGTAFHSEKGGEFIYGPYIRLYPPPLPVGRRKGYRTIAGPDATGVGWIYDKASGTITANCDSDETDASGKKYSDY